MPAPTLAPPRPTRRRRRAPALARWRCDDRRHGRVRVRRMSATRINHVSVSAPDLEASVEWYAELFGARPIPTPNFGFPVQWLGIGDTQLHLFNREVEAPTHHHFAITVDDVEPVYTREEQLGAFDRDAFAHHIYELPGDIVQVYLQIGRASCRERL